MRLYRYGVPSATWLAAACLAASATAALAQAPQLKPVVTGYTAETATAAFQGAANAGGVAWQCAAGRCSASGPVARPTVQACSELARTVGALRSFAYGQSALGSNELGQCNAAVAAAPKPGSGPRPQAGMMPPGPMGSAPPAPALPAAPGAKLPQLATPQAMRATTPDAERKLPGARGTPQAAARGDGNASSPPPQSPSPAAGDAGPRPAGPFSPVAVRTPQLTLTGIGVAEISYRFTPVAVRTPQLTLTGIGVAETSYRFTPVAVRTPQLTLTGTGRSE